MLKQKELMIIASLRKNSRQSLTQISKRIKIPISTIFDRLKEHERTIIRKHTSLVDFSQLGFNTRAHVVIKTKDEDRAALRSFLLKHPNVNSLYKTNSDYDFLIDTIFRDIIDLENFIESMREMFTIIDKKTYYLVDDIKREEFFSDPDLLNEVYET